MPEPDYALLREIALAAEKHSVDPAIFAGLVAQESSLAPEAVGEAGMSYGLMQLHLEGAGSGRMPAELIDSQRNLDIGTAYYKSMLDQFGTTEQALSAYNQGGAGLERNGIINQAYVDKVLGYADDWRGRMREVAILMHLDAAYGHAQALEQLLTVAQGTRGWIVGEILAVKRAAGLE